MNHTASKKAIRSAVKKMASYIRNWLTPERTKMIVFFSAALVIRALLNETKPDGIRTALTSLLDFLYAIY